MTPTLEELKMAQEALRRGDTPALTALIIRVAARDAVNRLDADYVCRGHDDQETLQVVLDDDCCA